MNAAEIIAVVMAVLVAVLAGVLVATLQALTKSLREVRDAVERLREDTLPLVDELHAVVDNTVDHVERVDRLITAAEGIEARVDSASRLAYRTIQSPVVKALAVRAGVAEAGKRLRGKAAEPAPLRVPKPEIDDDQRSQKSTRRQRRRQARRVAQASR